MGMLTVGNEDGEYLNGCSCDIKMYSSMMKATS